MKALIGVDGSPASDAAIQFAGRVLAADRDEVILFYAPPGGGREGMLAPLQLVLADAVFRQARTHLPEVFQPKVQTIACARDPAQGLPLVALDGECDLLVVGARGTGPLHARPLGSVARFAADHASVPVLVVRGAAAPSCDPLSVLLASDGSQTSRRAAEFINRLTWPRQSRGQTLTVIEPEAQHHLPEWLHKQLDDQQLADLGIGQFAGEPRREARIRKAAARWHGQLPDIFSGREPLVATGHAAEEILAAIVAHAVDLVVVGARRRAPLRRMFLGSTSSTVVAHSPCSVLVVRGADN